MRFRDAKKLHNGDEVIDKNSGESIKVLKVVKEMTVPGQIMIEGIGTKQGYQLWEHTTVK